MTDHFEQEAVRLAQAIDIRIQTSRQVVGGHALKVDFVGTFASWITQALRAAYQKGKVDAVESEEVVGNASAMIANIAWEKGFEAAKEMAAKVAEGRKFYDPEGYLAQAIRALQPSEKTGGL